MNNSEAAPDSLRKLIHDLNGELFLIRGYLDLIHRDLKGNQQALKNHDNIKERLDEVESIIKSMHQNNRS